MKFLMFLILPFSALLAAEYYAKVEPYEIREISSNVSGEVLVADEKKLGKKLSDKAYIKIDSYIDEKELNYTNDKLKYLQNTLTANEKILQNLEELLLKKRENFENVKALKTKSKVEKDREFYDLINSENQLLNTKKEIQSLNVQISDLSLRKAVLEKSIQDKNLKAKGFVLYELNVKPGKVVNPSAPLAKVADISKAKLTIYLDKDDLLEANKKIIYIDDRKTDYKISRLVKIADSTNISRYMAQIIIDAPKVFSNLVKVELKDE
jgi:hypothetical protein